MGVWYPVYIHERYDVYKKVREGVEVSNKPDAGQSADELARHTDLQTDTDTDTDRYPF